MADKTQVFPLDRNDGVRTRLTHSHEVSNLARSIGSRLTRKSPEVFDTVSENVPVILATVGLAHDLGNPPFGHQGEVAIRDWFRKSDRIFDDECIQDGLRQDFLNFEGNAQTIRLVTRLQVSVGTSGLDLTAATLAALMKYTVPASRVSKNGSATEKKPGYFVSEEGTVNWVRKCTGLSEGQRHPLTWLLEACDDIAYSTLDIEDGIKKRILSPEDVLAYLIRYFKQTFRRKPHSESKDQFGNLIKTLSRDFEVAHERSSIGEASDVKSSYLRTRLIDILIRGASDAFEKSYKDIFSNSMDTGLLESDTAASLVCGALKSFAREHAFAHPSVLMAEHQGSVAMSKLMDWLWEAITERENIAEPDSRRKGAFNVYVYELISNNYKEHFYRSVKANELPMRYCEMQLLTDMMSGMTDSFSVSLFAHLEKIRSD